MTDSPDLDPVLPVLRRRVAELRAATMRRSFETCVEVVSVAESGVRRTHHDGHASDRGLQVDLLCRLMAGADGPVTVVVVRSGHHDEHTEADGRWAGAAQAAADICGLPLAGIVMVSRWGWLDLLTGRRRDWKRLRLRPC